MNHLKYIAALLATWLFIATGNHGLAITFAFFTGVFMTSAAYGAEFKKLQDQRDQAWLYMDELKKAPK